MPRLPKLPGQWYSTGPGNLGSLDSNNEIQSCRTTEYEETLKYQVCFEYEKLRPEHIEITG